VKKSIISTVLILIMLIYPAVNAFEIYSSRSDTRTATDTDILSQLSQGKVEKVRQNIAKVQQELASQSQQNQQQTQKQEILDKLEKGEITYRSLFRNVYIMGDSLMNGLETYNILNGNNLITQVSASLYHLKDNISKIVRMNPEILILHYGLNNLESGSHQPAKFIKFYTEIITELKEKLPDTRIIVSSIFPVDKSKAGASRFERIDDYNNAMKEMCSQLSVEYLDNTPVFTQAEKYYATDGIHLSREFYEKYWLRSIVTEKEIYK